MVLRIEDISFIGIYINDSFRDFKDINDYANYHVSLLNNKRYQAFSGGDFIDRVVKGGYATDPNYKRALSNVYNQIAKAQEGMKIPKLQNAGELKARILRQFNKEKAANRNEEQLIGFDWSRYKSNKPKPETTPTQSEQLENGGVIKAQDGIIAQAINKVKSFLPKEEPKEPVDVVDIIKEYAPSAATSFLSGSVNPFINKLLEGKKSSLDYSHKFGSTGNKFEEFASVMTPIFKEALEENGLPITNLNNLVRQAALESNYGLDPRGERGFNLSGIKHPGDSIAPKYKKSRYKDGFDYIDFDNLKDYANYKVKVLNDRYKALDAKDTNDFIDRLHGNNSGGYNYSADKDSYRRNLNGTLSLNKYLKRGGILKYQNPSSGIQRRDAIKDYRPQIQEPIKQQYTPTYSEISQDNRSEWEKSQSREKADKAYKDYMQAKNTEEAIRTLDGLATMSDYIGLGAGVGSIIGRGLKYAGKRIARNAVRNNLSKDAFINTSPIMAGSQDVSYNARNFIEYLMNPATKQRISDIDAKLGTKYTKATNDFVQAYKEGNINLKSRVKGDIDATGDIITSSQSFPSSKALTEQDYKHYYFDVLKKDPAATVGHEFKHGIENYNAILMKPNMSATEYEVFRQQTPRLQELMRDNIVSQDDFVKSVKEAYPSASVLGKRFIVFEIDSIKENRELFPVVTIIIMEAFINKMRRLKGVRKQLIVEEAWKALSSANMAEYLRYMYKTVRKYYGEAIVVTQEVDDIISSPVVKESIINNSDCKILLDQRKYMNKFDQIQALLGLTEKEKSQILSINMANNPSRLYKEVWIGLGGTQSAVYATEVSAEEYLAYTTEETEKVEVYRLAEKLGDDIEAAIRQLAERRRNKE